MENKLVLDHADNAVDEEDHAEEKDKRDKEGGAEKVCLRVKVQRHSTAAAV